jgi:hypothetical protein
MAAAGTRLKERRRNREAKLETFIFRTEYSTGWKEVSI